MTSPAVLSAPARTRRRSPALSGDARSFGLARRVVPTGVGQVVVRAGARQSDTALLLLHGAAGSWTTWTPLLRAAHASGRPMSDVVALDLPGWGESALPHGAVTVEQMSRAVGEVAVALGYVRWIVVGHSLGGILALDLAAREPERTCGVLLVSPTGPAVLDAIRRPLRGGVRLPGFVGMLLAMRTLKALGRSGDLLVGLLHRWGLLRKLSAPLFADLGRVHPSVISALAREIRARAFVRAARAAADYDVTVWRRITSPVRSVRGARDVFVGAGDGAALAGLVPDFAQHIAGDSGHFAAIEQPECVLAELRLLR